MPGRVVLLQAKRLHNLSDTCFRILLSLFMQISIIIPVYNEAENIAKLVSYLMQHSNESITEIIVVDAGSTDHTIEVAKNAGATVFISTQKGRAAQMNHGASLAKGGILYFIHADTFPPTSFANDIKVAVEKGFDLGRYHTKFNSNKWYLNINGWFTRFDWFICMGGDQTIFVTRKLFEETGGYIASMRIMEEYEFAKRARVNHRYKIFSKRALVSARKYDTNSWWRVQMANMKILSMYKKGATQEDMVNTYKRMLDYR
ncbi:MAG: TIGR04283 family arsenosugar biosynthesis glycosyltransferase [Bacteroidota bacterium]|nr:TIGR04283 family arsenosugar biosynthesis glycosyltransferase [Bacteroidota bacterium]